MAVASNPLETFIWGAGGQKMSPEQVARQREIAAALMQGGMDYSPVGHWTQGLARASQGLVGGLKDRWAGEAEQRGREGFQSQWDSVFGGGSASPVAAALSETTPALDAANQMAGAPVTDWLEYANQGATRNQPIAPELVNAMSFLPEMGVTMRVVSGGQEASGPNRVGSTRHDHGNAGDVDFYQNGRKLDWNNEADLPILSNIVSQARANGVTGIGAGDDYMGAGRFHIGFGNEAVWGAGGKSENAPDWLRAAYSGAPAPARTHVAQVAQAGGGNPSVAQLIALAGNEWANPGQSSVVSALLGQAMQQQDPRYQQDLAMGDLQLRQLQQQLNAQPYQPRVLTPGEMEQWGLPSNSGSWVLPENGIPQNLYSAPALNTDFETITIDVPGVGPQTFNTADPQQYQIANDLLAQGATEIKTPAAQVNIGAETGYDSTVGKGMGERYLSLQDEASTARSTLNSLDIMEQAMSQPGFYSGFGADQLAQVKKLGQSLGLNVDGIDSMEAFNAQAKSAALDTMGGSLGTGFSNADRDFVLDQVPTLSNTPQGNAALIKVQRAINQRKIDVARLSREYSASNNGRLDAGFDDYLADWAEKNPLFPDGGVFGTPAAPSQNTTSSGVTWSFVD